MDQTDRTLLTRLFDTAVAAADPARALAAHLPARPAGRTVVVGAGKGAAQLAAAFETLWDGPLSGVVVTRYGYACPTRHIRVIEAAHPVPDAAGLAASAALMQAVSGLGPDDLVVALICGGGSALLPMPPGDLTLEDEAALNRALLASGAPISAMNAIRKQVSGIKGGRLALAAAPAQVVTLVVSDVPGDDPAQVASGPTVPDATSRTQARALVANWRIDLPPTVADWLAGHRGLAPDPADPAFARTSVQVIASARLSLEAAAAQAQALGIPAVILSDAIEGEAREVARVHAAIAREVALRDRPFARPVVLLSGGETTVTLKGQGKGGRNSEFLLALALATEGLPFAALAADTDGIDGSEQNAGAFATGSTAASLRALGHDPAALLADNNAWTAFDALGDLFTPGPTGTNVNDFRAILIR
ncbi:hydroxypyruvate reductase [Gemmobacter megaterium]|uniref:Hydroxypyruvate reductase n=1 Tax=Gemmobacter megaterium TaxID=1086013 RepID=A0A1N7LSV1_9RHOB|nr:glycerate kinase [Gemmobacter megaterium]GGE10740.1 TtuD3 hydroxypyruvate reductase [Gemmobacter megaterium]SIS76926.1 hydroxypyruvate reductase [Gemmobacter megaterium]